MPCCLVNRDFKPSPFRACDSPEAICPALWKRSHITCVHLFDVESGVLNKGRNIPSDVAAFESPLEKWLGSFLPASYGSIRSESVFEENELAVRLQDSSDASNGLDHAGNSA